MFGYMLMANRKYVEPLYTTPIGWGMLIAATLLLSMGSFFMAKLAKVEV
jgi:tight adherence protein B